jgi:hypothetical protein
MDASACRVVYIDDRFYTERWLTRDGLSTPTAPQRKVSEDLTGLPPDLQANIHAVLSVFSQGTKDSCHICTVDPALPFLIHSDTPLLTRRRCSLCVQLWPIVLHQALGVA